LSGQVWDDYCAVGDLVVDSGGGWSEVREKDVGGG
jgi:hypothetical protein